MTVASASVPTSSADRRRWATLAVDVPAEDAGLGSGITTLSQQISGALGLAVLSTIAANHTKALADDHGPISALIGGYQLAFLAGALAISAGIVLAFALLRPRDPLLELELAPASAGDDAPTDFDIREKAA